MVLILNNAVLTWFLALFAVDGRLGLIGQNVARAVDLVV